jgi:hypothetical protein
MSKPEPALIFGELQNPVNWAYMAWALHKTASLIDWERNRVSGDWRYVPIYQMLIGFSLENLLKGILIAEGQGVDTKKLNHGLRKYADQVKGLKITESEKQNLARLEPYIKWAGRYPMPKSPDGLVPIGHSKHLHDDELALCQKLYDYLRRLKPEIEPADFLAI